MLWHWWKLFHLLSQAHSSVVECLPYMEDAAGSSPAALIPEHGGDNRRQLAVLALRAERAWRDKNGEASRLAHPTRIEWGSAWDV